MAHDYITPVVLLLLFILLVRAVTSTNEPQAYYNRPLQSEKTRSAFFNPLTMIFSFQLLLGHLMFKSIFLNNFK